MDVKVILEQRWVIPTAVGVVGVASGFTAGYFLGKCNGECIVYETGVKFDEEPDNDEEEAVDIPEEVVSSLEDDPEYQRLLAEEEAIEKDVIVKKKLLNGEVKVIHVEEVEEEVVYADEEVDDEEDSARTNVFDKSKEEEKKLTGEPYIISVGAYVNNVNEWTQETLNYWAGDDIVTTQDNTPVYNHSDILGPLNFGYGSNDRNTVYIRNEKMKMEWEVLKNPGRYEIEVLGHTLEQEYQEKDLKHSMDRKFRDD